MLQQKQFTVVMTVTVEDDFEAPFDESSMEDFINEVMEEAKSPYTNHTIDEVEDVTEEEEDWAP